MSSADDPRDASLEVKLTLPNTWTTSVTGNSFSVSSMLLAGAVMVTRNRRVLFLAWPAMLLGISGFFNQHPLRSKESGPSWQSLISGVSALIMSYLPMVLVAKPPMQVPLEQTA
ncbi:uncharacterized protein FOMMEDRAFT_109094 [Fomitiporia mediterranea MF3/22]|uniref:uncharacterized protein n=1 Tax=Fomitiporia mediterranea (strain MF3/22) TaxID=694068 RepID=UPI0004408FE3|nr:uncharacterized protein FOMMEDRAFT_109094 [Fomitiporia mediterranea MF3/22]EJD02006.1 hypothetical protein FOMMEDRAFT_109094 [Fomitiporia mediterranea MF3/22]